nr:4-alpha-glucanotransferase [Anaeromicropila herbilytica]
MPLYVSLDSSDVWVNGDLFELDERKNPINVAGVPPDAFSDDGQRWGNPLYHWEHMEDHDFLWWRERMKHSAKLYDVIRIDHFIGVVRYYSIPVECQTAIEGKWRMGPGKKLTDVIDASIGDKKIIAEDLGVVVPEVRKVLNSAGYPGMKIIEFAFDSDPLNEHLPHNYTSNMVVYGGTHDNETLVGFYQNKNKKEMKYALEYLAIKSKKELVDAIIKTAYASVAGVVIFQAQDILKLDNSARMNLPSTVGQNWRWRVLEGQLEKEHEEYLKRLAMIYGR